MKKTIYLHGYLRELHSDPIVVEANSVAEAVRSLELIPSLKTEDDSPHPVTIDGVDNEIHLFAHGGKDEIHIRPRQGGGGGKGGFLQILLGVALIGLAVFLGPGASLLGGMISSQSLFLAGAMMTLGGIVQLLTPTPETDDSEASKYTASTGNTVKIGTRIPILIGARKIFGHYLTLDVDSTEVDTGTTIGTIASIVADGTDPINARYGFAPYDAGQFSYAFWRPDTPEDAQSLVSFPPPAGWTMFARGYTADVSPKDLWEVISGVADTGGFVAKYSTWIRPVTTGVHTAAITGPEACQVTIKDDLGVPVVGALTAGQLYEVEVFFLRTFTIIATSSSSYQVTLAEPGGGAVALASSPILEDYNTTAPTSPPSIDVLDNVFIKYDEPALVDGITPIRPIFQNATTSMGEVPTSDWNP